MKITSKYFEYGNSRLGALLPIALFLIVSIASLTPFLIHNSEQSAERGIYNGEWAKIQWGLNGLRHSHAHKIDLGDNPTGATTVATISYGDFHVTASIMERKTLMGRNECFSMTPMIFRGAGTNADPYRDAGYNLEEITLTYDSMPGVAAGGNSSFAWRKDGYLYAWGSNGTKQLGVGDVTSNRTSPVLVEQGSLPTPKPTNYNNGWLVATGLSSSLIVDYMGSLYETGKVNSTSNYSKSPLFNASSNLAQGVLDVAVGDNFMVVIPDDGVRKPLIKSWNAKVKGGTAGYEVLKDEIQVGGIFNGKTLTTEKGASDAIGVAAGKNHYVVMTKEGHLWGVGDNSAHQLGSTDTTKDFVWVNDDIPIELVKENPLNGSDPKPTVTKFYLANKYIISTFTVTLNEAPKITNTVLGGTTYPYIKLVKEASPGSPAVTKELDWKTLNYTGTAKPFVWKYESNVTELLPGTYTISVFNTTTSGWFGYKADHKDVTASLYKNKTNNQGVYSFYGKLISPTTFVGVAAGENFSVAVQREADGDILYSWGTNDKGQLGTGDTTVRKGISAISNFPPSGRTVKNIVAGNKHVLALLDNGDLYVWGDNSSGQLGITNPSPGQNYVTIPTKISNIAFGGKEVVSIAAGYNHSLAMDEDLTVYSWGSNSNGQLGRTGTASLPGEVTSFPVPSS